MQNDTKITLTLEQLKSIVKESLSTHKRPDTFNRTPMSPITEKDAMKESTRSIYQIVNQDTAKLKRWWHILEDFDAFIDEFGGCAEEVSDHPSLWDEFHKMYLVGFNFRPLNDTTIEVGYFTEISLAEYDTDGDPVVRYAKTWFAVPRTAKQVGSKLAKMLRRYADLIEQGTISPEYGIRPEEVDELIDFVKSNLEIESCQQ